MRGKKVVYNISSNTVLQVIIIIYGFLLPKIIISNFGSNVNGLISSVTQFLGYITLLQSGFGPVVKATLYKPIAQKNKQEIEKILKTSERFFRNIAKIFIIYIILLAVFYPLIVNSEFEYFYTFSLVIIISISTFAEYYFGMTYRLYLQAEQKNYIVSIILIVSYLINIGLVLLLAYLNCSIHVIKLLCGLIFALKPLIQNFYVKEKYNINLNNISSEYKIKNKWDGLAQHVAAVIHGNTDITVLTFFSTLIEVSIYSVYYLVVKGVRQIIEAFSNGLDASFGDMIAKKEHNNLVVKFNVYEFAFLFITCIAFSSTMILIVPFIKVYTNGITDANYIQYIFGYLIVISEYVSMVRQPYGELVKAAGHFKETRIGAWIECIINIVLSIFLVYKYGLIGVAIGTIVSTAIRTFEFIYHVNKHILCRNIWPSIKKVIILIIETATIVLMSNYLPYLDEVSYGAWIINALMTLALAFIISMVFSIVFFNKELETFIKYFTNIVKQIVKRK